MGLFTSSVFIHVALFFIGVLQSEGLMKRQLAEVDPPGFISIDCGSPVASNYNQESGLKYTWDEDYISTGTNKNLTGDVEDLYKTVRSFPVGTRNCYKLSPLKPKKKYLIRARFFYGNYDGRNIMPEFDVYIGVNRWFSVQRSEKKYAKEMIHYSVTDAIDVCFVNTGFGVPFVSALELRPLDDDMYIASSDFSLYLWNRWDVGRSESSSEETNDDPYNRLWAYHPWANQEVIHTNNSFIGMGVDPYQVPNDVLSTACEGNSSKPISTSYNTSFLISEVYAYWHFAELELLGVNDTREFNIHVPHGPGYTYGPIRPKYLQATTITSDLISLNGSTSFVFSLNKTDESNRYPILNAVELYKKLHHYDSPTNQEDINGVTTIKDNYEIPHIWQGDPCLPKNTQWEGLTCDYIQTPAPRIIKLNLPSNNLTGELPQSLSKLTSLQSFNKFTGKIPEFLAQMPLLNDIDLTGNNLTGPIPTQLLKKACSNSIILRLEGVSDACTKIGTNKKKSIIPLVSSIASISILVIVGFILFALKRRQKQGLVYRTLKSRNKRFRYSEIVRITDNFRTVIGLGGFGIVYHGNLQDGIQVAVKILNNTSSAITAELLTKIHHVNLVSLIGYCEENSNMALVYEYMSSGNLKMHLSDRNKNPLSWKTRLQISIDAAQGLEYLHSGCQPPIIHRDIKPENILLDEMGHAKLSDLGLSRFFTNESEAIASTDIAGTLGYIDPELSTISEKCDIYGFGVVLLEVITGKAAIIKQANRREERIHIIKWATEMMERGDILEIVDKRLKGEFREDIAWKFLEIAMACVNLFGSQRPSMSQVVAHLKCYAYEGSC
ncbi:hypothetical protein V2J09_004691 [Rumex salicifolius]